MAITYKVLGQVAPSAASASAVYTVPSATQAVVSTIFVCNRSASSATVRISVRPDGAGQADQHYIAYDTPVDANAFLPITTGITLGDTDVVTVYASSSAVSFSAFGSEITA